MKKTILKAMAAMAEKSIAKANSSTCFYFSYQPKAPLNIKSFKKQSGKK